MGEDVLCGGAVCNAGVRSPGCRQTGTSPSHTASRASTHDDTRRHLASNIQQLSDVGRHILTRLYSLHVAHSQASAR